MEKEKEKEMYMETQEIPRRGADLRQVQHAAVGILAEAGMPQAAIARAIGRHYNTVNRVVKIKEKEKLSSPRKRELASRVVEATMEGYLGRKKRQPDGTVTTTIDPRVRASDATRAAELVYRASGDLEPTTGGGGQTFIQINQRFFEPYLKPDIMGAGLEAGTEAGTQQVVVVKKSNET